MTPALGLTVYHPDKVDHGYTLFAPMTGTSAYLIDMQGRIVHHWVLPYRPGATKPNRDGSFLARSSVEHSACLTAIP
jgi:hypothetical protein